jgi:hypothetical protein
VRDAELATAMHAHEVELGRGGARTRWGAYPRWVAVLGAPGSAAGRGLLRHELKTTLTCGPHMLVIWERGEITGLSCLYDNSGIL